MRLAPATTVVILGITIGAAALNARRLQNTPPSQPPRANAPTQGRGGAPTPPCGPNLTAVLKTVDNQSRCFELRTYTLREGGSNDLLHGRFRDLTTGLFKKHGMTIIGFWQPVTKPDTLVYMLAHKDGAARDASWAAFQADPEWIKERAAGQPSLQIETVFMSAVDYSPMK